MILQSSIILLLPIITHASSNTVSITHRSIGTRDYTQGLNVVKDVQDDKEYVTSFYKRVQHKVKDRDGLFSKEYEEDFRNEQPAREYNVQPSKIMSKPFSFMQTTNSQDAAEVRGGAAASSLKLQSAPSFNRYGDRGNHSHHGRSNKKSSFKSPSFQRRPHRRDSVEEYDREYDDLVLSEYDEYVEGQDFYTSGEDQDDYPPGEHHLGLLRVPCSIAINSGEDGRFDSYADVSRRGGGLEELHGTFSSWLFGVFTSGLNSHRRHYKHISNSQENTHCGLC